jgi:hypothetical protein
LKKEFLFFSQLNSNPIQPRKFFYQNKMNIIPFHWVYQVDYFYTAGFSWELRMRTHFRQELPLDLDPNIRSVRFVVGFNRFQVFSFATPVTEQFCFIRILNYFNEINENGKPNLQ